MTATGKKPHDAGIGDLYGLPLAEFTSARNALAKSLRAAGERKAADEAAAARKPTVAAWAVNQLVRRERKSIEQLMALGDDLRQAQAALVAGREAGGMIALSDRERKLVQALVKSAARILKEDGGGASEATLDQVGETLHAAALDEEAASAVAGGRLIKERRAIGLGLGSGGPAPRRAPRKQARPPAGVARAERRLTEARAAASEAREAAQSADRALRQAEREAAKAGRAADQAAERERRAADALERARAKG